MHVRLLILFLSVFSSLSLFAVRIDPNATSFDTSERRRARIDTYDFSGEYPQLSNIDIDGRRKRDVELILTGAYPILEKITYDGGFGTIKADLTGEFPLTEEVNISCTESEMDVDLTGKWKKDCLITVSGTGNIRVILPKDVPIMVTTNASPLAKIKNENPEIDQRKRRITQRVFATTLPEGQETQEYHLKISIVATKGEIVLK